MWLLLYYVSRPRALLRCPSCLTRHTAAENGVIREEEFLCSEQEMESLLAHFEDIEAAVSDFFLHV